MAPGAVAIHTNAANDKKEGDWNMDSALDFDLLAEYLLEDVGAGGFDFRYVMCSCVKFQHLGEGVM